MCNKQYEQTDGQRKRLCNVPVYLARQYLWGVETGEYAPAAKKKAAN